MSALRPRPRADWRDVITIQVLLLGPMALLFLAGYVEPSAQARRTCLPAWIVLGIALFAWTMRGVLRRIGARGGSLSAGSMLAIASLFVVLCGISTFTLSLALPAIAHRWASQPQEVRTVVSGKTILRSKRTSYCLATPPFDPRLAPMNWCASRAVFDQAHVGEAIVLHGTTSWFGFMRGGFDLVPTAPDDEALKTGFLTAPTPSPLAATMAREADAALAGGPLRAWPGDDLAKLEAAYPGSPAPSPYRSGDRDHRLMLRLADRGLWFFLTADGTVNTVRVESPFADAVDGVRLGDALEDVQRVLGADGRRIDAGQPTFASYVFATPAAHHLRVDLDAAQRVRTIFLFP